MNHYYNEFDPKNVAWLRELMEQGHIPHGVIDGRSIKDVVAADVAGDGQRHFFAGISGWSEALRLAGWPADRSVWTGSCPCQPYSTAGKRKGSEDERDLWPEFFRLIRECRPETIFGEQVASGDVVGTELEVAFVAAIQASNYARANRLAERIARVAAKRNESLDELVERWVDRICADLEAIGYAVWPIVFGAHSVLSPHKRQRLYWMAHAKRSGVRGSGLGTPRTETSGMQDEGNKRERLRADTGPVRTAELGGVANPSIAERKRRAKPTGQYRGTLHTANGGSSHGLGHASGTGSQERICHGCIQRRAGLAPTGEAAELSSHTCRLGDPNGSEPFTGDESTQADGHGCAAVTTSGRAGRVVNTTCRGEATAEQCGQRPSIEQAGYWSDYRVVQCRDGKARRIPVEPAFQPLAHGSPSRVVRLRGYGNAIVPQVAAVFIKAFLETEAEEG